MAESSTIDKTSDEDVTVNHIRDELRDEINLIRKQQRDISVNKNRASLDSSNDGGEIKEDFVTKVAKSLKKKSLSTTEYNKLQNALMQSENHVKAFFKVDNALHGLIRDLSGSSNQPKLSAANCCCNLALGNSKACFTLCKFAAPYLLAELESTSEPLVEACLWTIGNLVTGSDKTFPILHAQGCMKSLINLVHQCSDELLPSISYASVRYVHAGVDVIDKSEIIQLGTVVAQRYPSVSDVDTMWLLATLSSIPECFNCLTTCSFKVCDYLLETVSNDTDSAEKVSAALRIVCNMVSETSGQVAQYLLRGESEKYCTVLSKLLSHPYLHIRKETLWL